MKSILFICVENRARSQMAEGLARHFLGHQFDIFSAGAQPAKKIHPLAKAVMAEVGVDISGQRPKGIDEIPIDNIQLAVTLCAPNMCPALPPHIKTQHWVISDPVSSLVPGPLLIKKFRKVRDEIKKKILDLRSAQQNWQL